MDYTFFRIRPKCHVNNLKKKWEKKGKEIPIECGQMNL